VRIGTAEIYRTLGLLPEVQDALIVNLDLPAATVTVDIKDAAGQVVRELQLGKQDAGVTRFDWDGKTTSGDNAAAGDYTFSVTATNGSTAVSTTVRVRERFSRVSRPASLTPRGRYTVTSAAARSNTSRST